ncbi:MAG TPA: GNAT family N-acetyltransferase [Armatimonadota bacterium]|nr:GNAT family N-acetyltransferase [Armatimonadota bacterium]
MGERVTRRREETTELCFKRRPAAWKEFDPLDLACAAALGIEPSQVRPDLLLVEGTRGSAVTGGAPCPLVVIETFRGVAVRVHEPLRAAIEDLVREGMEQGAALSCANRERLVQAVMARLTVVEVWHDLLHYTDRAHFVPWRGHRVRRLPPPALPERRPVETVGAMPVAGGYGAYVKGELAAYADIALRGDYACAIGVFTEQEFRGRGLGRSVVSAATRAILGAGRIPLYSTDEAGLASLAVCRSLGYLRFGQDLYCFLAPEQERARREQAKREAERRARDIALQRWIID